MWENALEERERDAGGQGARGRVTELHPEGVEGCLSRQRAVPGIRADVGRWLHLAGDICVSSLGAASFPQRGGGMGRLNREQKV